MDERREIVKGSNVKIIPATAPVVSAQSKTPGIKRRAAAYARVSTDSDEQLTSYEAQMDYYTKLIKNHEDWTFVKCYADEGKSATNTRYRDGFNEMINDALAGKIDLIITKSISRFARNTVDSLQTVRALKDKGIEIWFEKENVFTLDSKGELMLTILSSLAQEESRNLSENVAWGHRKRFSDGKIIMPYGAFLGYEKGADGLPQIVPEEAETVKLIYKLYLEGKTPHTIAKTLTSMGKPTPTGRSNWYKETVLSILRNERYRGSALSQKYITINFLTHQSIKNDGRAQQYYVEESHPAIISPETFDLVQREMERRRLSKSRHSGTSLYSGKIICGDCGHNFGAKTWHSTDIYKRTVFQCNNKFHGENKCTTPHLTEAEIKRLFVAAANKVLGDKKAVIAAFRKVESAVFDTTELVKRCEELSAEMAVVAELNQKLIEDNARTKIDQEAYRARRSEFVARHDKLQAEFDEADAERRGKESRKKRVDDYLRELKNAPDVIAEFDKNLWIALLESVTVYSAEDIRFKFKDGTVVKA